MNNINKWKMLKELCFLLDVVPRLNFWLSKDDKDETVKHVNSGGCQKYCPPSGQGLLKRFTKKKILNADTYCHQKVFNLLRSRKKLCFITNSYGTDSKFNKHFCWLLLQWKEVPEFQSCLQRSLSFPSKFQQS